MNTTSFDFLDEPANALDIATSTLTVPNQKPTVPFNGIFIIGEAPGSDEVSQGKPFVGTSGRFLNAILAKSNILRDACYLGNLSQHRPPSGDISSFSWDDSEIQSGITTLNTDLSTFQPNLVLLLGNAALHYFKEGNVSPPTRKKGTSHHFDYPNSISDWRGSLFQSHLGFKCLSTFHPAACLRNYSWTPLLIFDMAKAKREAITPIFHPPLRNLDVELTSNDIVSRLTNILHSKQPIAIDIEGGIGTMSCISFATSPASAFIVPFSRTSGHSYWSQLEDELAVWNAVVSVLTSPDVPKILQNSLYDRFVLMYSYHVVIRNVIDDTMLKHWEYNCELEKSLGFMCSIHTSEPFYKAERHNRDQLTFYRYCCKDSATTFEINSKLSNCLSPAGRLHYQLNLDLLNPLLYLQQRGFRYNYSLAQQRVKELSSLVYPYQFNLDQLARNDGVDVGFDPNLTTDQLLASMRSITGYSKDPFKPKADFVDRGYHQLISDLQTQSLTPTLRGRANILCKRSLNIKSPVFKSYLYDTLNLPIQLHPATKKPTTDYTALLRLTKKSSHPSLKAAIEIARLRTRLQTLAIKPCSDGRMRWSTNIVGSETGRITTGKSIIPVGNGKRSGTNMQGIPDDWDMEDPDNPLTQGMRDLLQADPGWFVAKCDLKGADGWTVGAYLNKLGDSSMLQDLKFGLKPAQKMCYVLRHGTTSLQGKSRLEQKELLKEVKKDDWDYYVCKQGIWGTCYTMGPRKLAERVFVESEGKVILSESDSRTFQGAVFALYQIKRWHADLQRQINNSPYPFTLTSTVGHTRKFWGRKQEILGEVLAHLPQEYTTHATKLAAAKLWNDPDNLINDTIPLRIEILHQVHDELVLHFRQSDLDYALNKIRLAFNNTLIIAGQPITIPFDGAYGTDWSLNEASKVGSI